MSNFLKQDCYFPNTLIDMVYTWLIMRSDVSSIYEKVLSISVSMQAFKALWICNIIIDKIINEFKEVYAINIYS